MEVKNNFSGISMENIDYDEVRQMWMEQRLAKNSYWANGYSEPYPGYYIERLEAVKSLESRKDDTVEEKKPYSEMSMEELKDALHSAECAADLDKRMLDKTEWFTGEYAARENEYNASMAEVNAIKSEIFGRNQEASLSRLNEKSLAALEEYYQFDCESHLKASTLGMGMEVAEQIKLRKNAKNALEEQGISGEEFKAVYEYYRFKRDAENTAEMKAEIAEEYQNSNIYGKVGMNAETVIMAPARGIMATPELVRSLFYEDPYAPLNVNASDYGMTIYSDTVREETTKDIESDAWKVAYQVGMNVADAAAITVVTGGIGYAVLPSVANSSTSAAKTATENGASKEQALKMALGSGLIDAFAGKIPLDKVPILQGDDLLTQSLRQGLEQACGTGANAYLDSCINGNNSQFNQSVETYITEMGLTEDAAIKRALIDVLNDMGISCMSAAYSNVTKNVNVGVDVKVNRNSKEMDLNLDVDMSIAPYTVKANSNVEKTNTNTTKQHHKSAGRDR